MSTDVAVRPTEEALAAMATADLEIAPADLQIPLLKVGQALTREVAAKDAEAGDFIHSLTGDTYGDTVEIVVVDAFKGRAWRDQANDRFYSVGRGVPVVPWEEHPCHGVPFVDCPDAEEQYRAAVQNNEHDYGKGPGISTTYNFVGLLVGEEGELENFPVRISLMRAAAKTGRNWQTLLNIAKAPWDFVFEVSTYGATSKSGKPFTGVKLKQSRKTTPEERANAVEMAQLLHSGTVNVEYDEAVDEDGPPTPAAATSGLAI